MPKSGKNLLCSILIIISGCLFGQHRMKVIYKGHVSIDETNATSKFSGQILPSDFILSLDDSIAGFNYVERLIVPLEDSGPIYQMSSENYFIDLKEKVYFVEEVIFGKKFLISDTLPKFDWKISGETDQISGYSVRKATAVLEENVNGSDVTATAWYAPKIPISLGPELYGGLPGLILKLDMYSTTSENAIMGDHYEVDSIEFPEKPLRLKRPKGIPITEAEAEAMSEEQFQKIIESSRGGVDKD